MPRTTSRESAPAAAQQAAAIPSVAALKQAARRVVDFFALKKGLRLKHSDALELVAVVHGARNWQTLLGVAQTTGADTPAAGAVWSGHAAVSGNADANGAWLAQQLAANLRAHRASLTVVESKKELEALEHALGHSPAVHVLSVRQLFEATGFDHPGTVGETPALRNLAEHMHYDGQWVVNLVGSDPAMRQVALTAVARLCRAIFELRLELPVLQFTPFIVTTPSGDGLKDIFEQGRRVNMSAVALCDGERGANPYALANSMNVSPLG